MEAGEEPAFWFGGEDGEGRWQVGDDRAAILGTVGRKEGSKKQHDACRFPDSSPRGSRVPFSQAKCVWNLPCLRQAVWEVRHESDIVPDI